MIVQFNNRGAQLFSDFTGQNVKKRLAIIFDNMVISAPTIQSKITGGTCVIRGFIHKEEIEAFKVILLNEPFPLTVNVTQFDLINNILENNHE